MYLVAIGAAKLLYWWDNTRFALITALSLRQARRAPGNLRASVFPHAGHYFSLTVWQHPSDMQAFASSGAHRFALKMADRLTETSRFHVYASPKMPTVSNALAAWHQALPAELARTLRAAPV